MEPITLVLIFYALLMGVSIAKAMKGNLLPLGILITILALYNVYQRYEFSEISKLFH